MIILIIIFFKSSNVISQASPPSANWAKQNQIVVSRGANRNIRTLKNNFYKFTNTNESVKSMTKRSVDGTNGCLHTGSAVMVNNTQVSFQLIYIRTLLINFLPNRPVLSQLVATIDNIIMLNGRTPMSLKT